MTWRKHSIKIWPADKWFSLCIREAQDHICQSCGGEATDCAHIVGRGNFATRWCKQNALALCRGCHDKYGSDPIGFSMLVENLYPNRGDMLMVKRRGILKNNAETRQLIATHYNKQYRLMQKTGDKEFESWN